MLLWSHITPTYYELTARHGVYVQFSKPRHHQVSVHIDIDIHLVELTSNYITQRGKSLTDKDTHGTKSEKGMISRMSDQANTYHVLLTL